MDGVHDMGGMHGFGPVDTDDDGHPFHAPWEGRVFAMNNALGALGYRNLDESRHSRERMKPADYLSSSYYRIWLEGIETLLGEKGLLTGAELATYEADPSAPPPPLPLNPPLDAEGARRMIRTGGKFRINADIPPRFKAGDRVRARNIHPEGHTRLPRYARCHEGVVEMDHGVFIFPDTHAHGRGAKPQRIYSVRFTSRELWGEAGNPNDSVNIDLWDDYLDPADGS